MVRARAFFRSGLTASLFRLSSAICRPPLVLVGPTMSELDESRILGAHEKAHLARAPLADSLLSFRQTARETAYTTRRPDVHGAIAGSCPEGNAWPR